MSTSYFIQIHTKTPSEGDRAYKSYSPGEDLPALSKRPRRHVVVASKVRTVYRPLAPGELRSLQEGQAAMLAAQENIRRGIW